MPPPLSAVDAVSPAFEQTKRLLFQPFRFGHWARLAVVSLLTGEFAGGGGGGGGNVSIPSKGGGEEPEKFLLWLADPIKDRVLEFLPWIVAGVVALICLGLIWMYASSVFRFVLLDSVLTDRCQLRAGWGRWQEAGSRYFLWQIGLIVAMLAILALLVGVPVYLAWQAGIFREPDKHVALLVLGGVVVFFGGLGLFLVAALVGLFAKDFVVPLMALENLGVMEAWRRLLPLLAAEKAAYAGYVLMKIVLAVGSAILLGIVNFVILLILLIPLAVVGVALVLVWKAAGLGWGVFTISAAVLGGGAVLMGLFYVVAFASVPAVVFFQSYTLHFFAGRYPVLGALMTPAPPARPAAAPAPVPAS